MPPQDQFKKQLPINSPFVATGYIGREYADDIVSMYVGIVQLGQDESGNSRIESGAYGMSKPALRDHDANQKEWTMQLRRDFEKGGLRAGDAVGFVLVELAGGRVTGWIDSNVRLIEE